MSDANKAIGVEHFIRGRLDSDGVSVCPAPDGVTLMTPSLDLNSLVWPRAEGFPAADLTLDDVLDHLTAVGNALEKDGRGYVSDALEKVAKVNPVGGGVLRKHMASAVSLFNRELMAYEYEQSLGFQGEGWTRATAPDGSQFEKRWFPTRTVHIMAGNTPHGGPLAIIRTSLLRGVALMKMPSNDPFTPIAVLRTMHDLDPDHPLVQCFSAAYWRGGDAEVESVLFRSQFFDKIIAWGGEGAIRNAVRYLGPGLELVSFDPKTSISIIGPEAFESPEITRQVADLAANDVRYQEGCGTSRHQYVQGTVEQADAYGEALLAAMKDYHDRVQGSCKPTPPEVVEAVDGLRMLDPIYKVWGRYDGSGLVVRSDEPVDFYPDGRTVNVVRLDSLDEVVHHVNVATQTVGLWPPDLKMTMRDALASGGVDRVANLGTASAGGTGALGIPHDGMIALHRMVRWIFSAV
jgi:hypothetical protein